MINEWRKFLSDWMTSVHSIDAPFSDRQAFFQHQIMVAILFAQQEASAHVKAMKKRSYTACQQFVADIKASSWHDDLMTIKVEEAATGVTYQYFAEDRVCFKGHLTASQNLPSPPSLARTKFKIEKQLVAHKLAQFKNSFPQLTSLWIFLTALITAHFFTNEHPFEDTELRRIDPLLKNLKCQFAPDAIYRAFDFHSAIPTIEYVVHKLSLGRYCVYTLSVTANGQNLASIALGLNQSPTTQHLTCVQEVDILIE